jgi:hypothetical protein
MTEGGLAKTTKAIQLGDELVEVDGTSVKVEWTRKRMSQNANLVDKSSKFVIFCNFPRETEIYKRLILCRN